MTSDDARDPRRTFCKVCLGGMGLCSAAAVGYPVVAFLGFPRRLSGDKPVEVPLAELLPGQAQYVSAQGKTVAVLTVGGEPVVLNVSCTHLGCTVIWDTADHVFRCPCHGAIFDAEGQVVSGPVSQPLKTVPFTVEDDVLIVS